MDAILSNLLVYSSINRGAYVLFNYIGKIFKLHLFRITVTTISLIINVLYLILYGYIFYQLHHLDLSEGFYHDRKSKMITAIISTILIVVIFLLSYFSLDGDQDFCKNVLEGGSNNLYYLDKVINLVYLLWIFGMVSGIILAREKLKAGKLEVGVRYWSTIGTILMAILMLGLKSFQLKLLLENKDLDKKDLIKKAVISEPKK